jgi:hypothetical protein
MSGKAMAFTKTTHQAIGIYKKFTTWFGSRSQKRNTNGDGDRQSSRGVTSIAQYRID